MAQSALTSRAVAELEAKLTDRDWRLNNLYQILDDSTLKPWVAYEEQLQFRRERSYRNFVPKARKLGLSTEIVIENGDECLWTKDIQCGIIDKTEEDAFAKLQIFRLAWQRGPEHPDPEIAWLWQRIHNRLKLISDNAGQMSWSNGAVYRAGTSFTGRTPQRLHISEYGPICALSATRAAEIQRGSINSVEPDGIIDIETTMEGGRAGLCYHYFKLAKEAAGRSDPARSDWRIHFFPWQGHPKYIEPGRKPTLGATCDYFRDLHTKYGITLSDERMAFWEAKRLELGEEIWTQYPSVVDEVERAAVIGAIYPEMAAVRSQGRVPEKGFAQEKGYPLYTAWDLGSSDNMAGWLIQPAGKAHNFLDFCCGEGQGAAGVASVIRQWERTYGQIAVHLLPHDANTHDKGSGKTYAVQLIESGISAATVRVVPRTPDVWAGIDEVRKRLPNSWFHPRCDEPVMRGLEKTPSGIQRLEGYRKRVNAATGLVASMPVKDGVCDHACFPAGTLVSLTRGDVPIEDVRAGEWVVTPAGHAKVTASGMTGMTSELVQIGPVHCTPNHPVFSDRGLLRADAIRSYSEVWTNQNTILASSLTGNLMPFRDAITRPLAGSVEALAFACIKLFGFIITALCRMVMRFTTRTMTGSTTPSKTSNAYWNRFIESSIPSQATEDGLDHQRQRASSWIGPFPRPVPGMEVPKAWRGTGSMESKHGQSGSLSQKHASSVSWISPRSSIIKSSAADSARSGSPLAMLRLSLSLALFAVRRFWTRAKGRMVWFARGHAGGSASLSAGRLETPVPVYNLTVDRHHCFYANGVLVSNCDAIRTYSEAHALGMVHAAVPRPEYNSYGLPLQAQPQRALTGFRR